ncbi:MAG TPA: DUF2461 family protein [Candidatus Dormibacteraeota bacterium]
MTVAFRGWPEEFQPFFIGLELDNSKRYFDANRETYETAVKGPMVALIDSLAGDYGEGKVFRANRDIRFSKDKSPYKTNIAATAGMGGHGGLHFAGRPRSHRRRRALRADPATARQIQKQSRG